LGWRDAFPAGVRSPLLRDEACPARMPRREEPGGHGEAIFSEGRALRVREDGPGASRGAT